MSDSSGISRRNFFGAGVTAGTIAALGTAVPLLGANTAGAAAARTFTGIGLALEFDGAPAGLLSGAEGGGLLSAKVADGATGAASASSFSGFSPGFPEPQPIKLYFGGSLSSKVLDWFASKDGSPHNVDVVMFDTVTGNEVYRLQMSRVVVGSFGLETLDASKTDVLEFVATLVPGQVSHVLTKKAKITGLGTKSKVLRSNLFRFFVQGLEQSTQYTVSVENLSFTRKLRLAPANDGRGSFNVLPGGPSGVDTIEAVLSLGAAGPFYQWFADQWSGKPSAKAGQVQLLTPDGQTSLATIDLIGLEPLGVSTPFDSTPASDSVARVKVSLLARDIKFNLKDLAA